MMVKNYISEMLYIAHCYEEKIPVFITIQVIFVIIPNDPDLRCPGETPGEKSWP